MKAFGRMVTVFAIVGAVSVPATAVLAQDHQMQAGGVQVDGDEGAEPALMPDGSVAWAGGGTARSSAVAIAIQSESMGLGEMPTGAASSGPAELPVAGSSALSVLSLAASLLLVGASARLTFRQRRSGKASPSRM